MPADSAYLIDHRYEQATFIGLRVFHPRRHFGKYFTPDQLLVLQFLQADREEAWADRDRSLQFVKESLYSFLLFS